MSTASLITPKTLTPNRVDSCGRRHRTGRDRTEGHDLAMTVSATSFDVDGEVRSMVRPPLPNYWLRRLLVGSAAALALTVGLAAAVGVVTGFSGRAASAASVTEGVSVAASVHVARPGDTMWSIADTYRGGVDRDRYINTLIDLNGGVDIVAGAAVILP